MARSILSHPKLLDAFVLAEKEGVLPEFMDALTVRISRENRARRKVRDSKEALERYNRMARARGMPEKTYL